MQANCRNLNESAIYQVSCNKIMQDILRANACGDIISC